MNMNPIPFVQFQLCRILSKLVWANMFHIQCDSHWDPANHRSKNEISSIVFRLCATELSLSLSLRPNDACNYIFWIVAYFDTCIGRKYTSIWNLYSGSVCGKQTGKSESWFVCWFAFTNIHGHSIRNINASAHMFVRKIWNLCVWIRCRNSYHIWKNFIQQFKYTDTFDWEHIESILAMQ